VRSGAVQWHLTTRVNSPFIFYATSNGLFVEVVNGGTLSDLGVCPALTILDGHAFPPSVPGNGLVFDWNRLEPFEVRP
jgi:hypothetical protein